MKVYNYGEVVIDMPIVFSSILSEDIIDNGDNVMLPYENKEFVSSLKSLIDDVVKNLKLNWKIPSYDKSKVYFYISGNKVYLAIEVFPKHYSTLEKQKMLGQADRSERYDGYSDYLEMLDMFDSIEHSDSFVGEIGIFHIKLSDLEKEKVLLPIK